MKMFPISSRKVKSKPQWDAIHTHQGALSQVDREQTSIGEYVEKSEHLYVTKRNERSCQVKTPVNTAWWFYNVRPLVTFPGALKACGHAKFM